MFLVVVALCLAPQVTSAATWPPPVLPPPAIAPVNLAKDLVAFEQNGQIWTIWGDGSHLRQITSGWFSRDPALSRDGRWIAYSTWDYGWNQIRIRNLMNGADQIAIINVAGFACNPCWSPDGRRIAFERWTWNGTSYTSKIMVISTIVHGWWWLRQPTRLTSSGPDVYEYSPAWGRNNLIAYTSDEGHPHRFTIRATSNMIKTWEIAGVDGYNACAPTWSPDGQNMAFVACEWWTWTTTINIVSANSTAPTIGQSILSGGDTTYIYDPSWAPSNQIYFICYCFGSGSDEYPSTSLCRVDPTTGEINDVLGAGTDRWMAYGDTSVSRNPFYHK